LTDLFENSDRLGSERNDVVCVGFRDSKSPLRLFKIDINPPGSSKFAWAYKQKGCELERALNR
jgi:hypothetical protein